MSVTASAPGRVNLIGEHLDYNGGRCLPIALPQRTRATVRPSSSLRVDESARAYVEGVLAALAVAERFEVELSSDVPLGAGLSSSAALICSVALAVDELLGLGHTDEQLVETCIDAETEHVGAPTGGLDQTASILCRQGEALLVDFATGSRERVPFRPEDDGVVLLVVDTRAPHRHLDGGYGDRRAECAQAARLLGVDRLVDASPEALAGLPAVLRRRTAHVLGEDVRVDEFVQALAERDWVRAGTVMTASHLSLRDDFEVSAPGLDAAVDAALESGALGARMTGGGFGGSAIALVPRAAVAAVAQAVRDRFARNGWEAPTVFPVEASAGARVEGRA